MMKNFFTKFPALVLATWLALPVCADSTLDTAITLFERQNDTAAYPLFVQEKGAVSLMYQARIMADKDLDKAEELIEQALELEPDNAQIEFTKGQIMAKQASNAFFSALSYAGKSLASLQRATQLQPNNTEYLMGLMTFYLEAPGIAGGDQDKARETLEQIKQLDAEQGALAHLKFERALRSQKSADFILTQLTRHPHFASLHYELGLYYLYQDDFANAASAFHAARQKLTSNEVHLRCQIDYQIGKHALLAQQNLAEGVTAMQYYIEHCPVTRKMPSVDWARFRLANLYHLTGQADQAAALYADLKHSEDASLQEAMREVKQ